MDISRVCKDEDLRQELIKLQKGDGTYNPHTGVYKWGEVVYDLTKTNGEIGLGWIPMKSNIINLIELKKILNTFDEYDNDGEPVEVYLPSGDFLTSPLTFVTQNAQKTVFLDHLHNED